jgi:hypothetical protein
LYKPLFSWRSREESLVKIARDVIAVNVERRNEGGNHEKESEGAGQN